jgi:hypothetical protein
MAFLLLSAFVCLCASMDALQERLIRGALLERAVAGLLSPLLLPCKSTFIWEHSCLAAWALTQACR